MWHIINCVLHVLWFCALLVVVTDYHFVDAALYDSVLKRNEGDIFELAVQLGRLDLVSLMIGVFSVAIAVATVIGFWFYQGVVERTAKAETSEILPEVLAKHFRDDPSIIIEAMKRNRTAIKLAAEDDEDGIDFSAEIAASMDGPDGPEEEHDKDP